MKKAIIPAAAFWLTVSGALAQMGGGGGGMTSANQSENFTHLCLCSNYDPPTFLSNNLKLKLKDSWFKSQRRL